ncbi:hypothetical protein SAMN04487819_10968 [Actinopolyspora alba]|uniref:DUF3558 domain-containing protein n=1 Tax=Actinopolyspora alba TaxID=673379 RepID=A0A1I1YNR1_9ACTN|nr:hypothetical protein [Actinopolyspora alba]SFE19793.1 hypothetical protein SAMN04487819_10968 [Actinopolyspora alba]
MTIGRMCWLRWLAGSLACLVVLAGCSGAGADESAPPTWVSTPPQHLSCDGLADPRLMVDVIQAADLGEPDPDDSFAEVKAEEPSLSCDAVDHDDLQLSMYQAKKVYLASWFDPPNPLLIPIGDLPGFVTHDYARLYIPCTRDSETVTLNSWVRISNSELDNPDARLAMARLLVDMTNKARARFGCAESANALSLPSELPDIPEFGMDNAKPVSEKWDSDTACPPAMRSFLPSYGSAHKKVWAMGTPLPSKLISVCDVRVGEGDYLTVDEVSGRPKVAFVTYKGIFAKMRHELPEYSRAEYDVMCHGEPVSYRIYSPSEDDSSRWSEQLSDKQGNNVLLDHFARAAAERAGCPLPE